MKSFELGLEIWRDLERRLRQTLDDITAERARFPQVQRRIGDVIARLGRAGLSGSANKPTPASSNAPTSSTQTEALSFVLRHPGAGQAERYRAAANYIHEHHTRLIFSRDLLKDLHGRIWAGQGDQAGQEKRQDAFVHRRRWDDGVAVVHPTIPVAEVRHYMQVLHEYFDRFWEANEIDKLLVIAAYVLDLFAIHPFPDGNGRTARLAMMLLLYQAGHPVVRYFSLEGAVARKRPTYCAVLERSMIGWEQARHDPFSWVEFVVDLVLEGYREVATRADRLEQFTVERGVQSPSTGRAGGQSDYGTLG